MKYENWMKDAAKRERELARRLLVQEADGNPSAPGMVNATERAFDRLYHHLSNLIGLDGFDVVAKRALHLATLECPYLQVVTTQPKPDRFRFVGLDAAMVGRQPSEVDGATLAILGYFFWLLVTFVGDNLFHRLIEGAWPGTTFEGKEPGSEETPS